MNNEIAFATKKYIFLNTESFPCVSKSQLEKCHTDCYLKEINKRNFTCQLPFLPKMHKTNCIANALSCNYYRQVGEIDWAINPHYNCNCVRECDKTTFISHYYFSNHSTNETSFYYISNSILSLTELFSYNIISLLCDIGGFLSLYAGLSCIQIIESIVLNTNKLFALSIYHYKASSHFAKQIIERIKELILKIQNNKDLGKENIKHQLKIIEKIKFTFIIFACIACCYYIYQRITLYRKYPVHVIIDLAQDRYVRIPNIIVCGNPSSILSEKEKIRKYKNLTVNQDENIGLFDLLSYPSVYANNISELWDATGEIDAYQDGQDLAQNLAVDSVLIKPRFGNLSYIDTVFGKCVKTESDSIEYHPTVAIAGFVYFPSDDQLTSYSHIFLMNEIEQRINLKIHEIQPYNSLMGLKLVRQEIRRQKTPTNPCTSLSKFSACEENCLNTKLIQKNINCRLPFVNYTHLPQCNTSNEAKKTANSYLDVFLNTDVTDGCNCNPPCNHTFLIPFTEYAQYVGEINFVVTKVELESNYNEIFQQELSMPLIKLICDTGSILGIFLGISILSCFDLIQKLLSYVSKYLN